MNDLNVKQIMSKEQFELYQKDAMFNHCMNMLETSNFDPRTVISLIALVCGQNSKCREQLIDLLKTTSIPLYARRM